MPCEEVMELEASVDRYTERRRENVAIAQDRRQGESEGFRAGEARFAYIVMSHRQTCRLCRAK